MGPWGALIRVLLIFETSIVERILRSPRFHHGVRKIHDYVEDKRHGRDPSEPLRQGEATREPEEKKFVSHFIDELRNQFRGTPTDPDTPPTTKTPASSDKNKK